MKQLGLQSRLLILTLLVLAGSLGLTGWVLDASFRASVVAAAEEQLELIIYSVMGAVEEAESGLFLPEDATQGGLSQPESGLYAVVQTAEGEALWVSRSARLSEVDFAPSQGRLAPGDFRFLDGRELGIRRFFLSYAVIWEDRGEEVALLFRAAADSKPFDVQVNEFRRNLWIGLLGVAGLLMLVQVVAVRVGLRPVRVMADEVAELEAGKRTALSFDYPHELTGLASNLDRFIEHETASRARYRNALDDLAHSLKTPLAVIRNALREDGAADAADRTLLRDQLDRMETTVAHQLSRAVSSGPVVVGHLTGVRRVVERLCRALETAYRDKNLGVVIEGAETLSFRGDERDLMEMLGNLIENAFKYTRSKVHVRVLAARSERAELGVMVQLDDDGPGIPAELQQQVLARGQRGDTAQQGQGIGLSVVAELVSLYGGELNLGVSDLGGARVELILPGT